MTKDEFLRELTATMNRDEAISENMLLDDIPEWDSLAKMCAVTLFEDAFGKEVNIEEIEKMVSVNDLLEKAGF